MCNPCGKNCSDSYCDNLKCSLGCADSKFAERVYDPDANIIPSQKIYFRKTETEHYADHKLSKNVNLNACHRTWETRSIDLMPVTLDQRHKYYWTAIPAMIINVVLVGDKVVTTLRMDE